MEIREETNISNYPRVQQASFDGLDHSELVQEGIGRPVKAGTQYILPGVLFIATVFTTLLTGAYHQGADPLRNPATLIQGMPFSFTLLAILLTHEFGHYFASKRHGVPATLPYFIPAPPIFLIGTLGAFIRMKGPILRKKALLDIGAAGPIAGFLVAIPAIIIGLQQSVVVKLDGAGGLFLGNPLLFSVLSNWIIGPLPDGYDVILHPIAFAGWIGLFVTFLNLIPIGQLDGGHIAYAFFGEKLKIISRTMVGVLILLGLLGWWGWFLWAFLAFILGSGHPPVIDGHKPFSWQSRMIGVMCLIIFLICFMPVPFQLSLP